VVRSNKQVVRFSKLMLSRYGHNAELFRGKLLSYWIRYALTAVQCRYLNIVKDRVRLHDWNIDEYD
jgi:hypothetical protein